MEYSEENEIQMIEDICNGQRNKYRRLVDRYSPMVFMIVRGFVDDEDQVEELAQQIFVKAYERIESYNGRSKFSTWLYSLGLNHCRDYAKNIRRQNKSFSQMEEHDLQPYMTYTETPDRQMEAKQWNKLIEEGLKDLSPEYAEAFLYKYRDEMTYEVMSNRLDASVSALKVRVHRARKQLKKFIENRQ